MRKAIDALRERFGREGDVEAKQALEDLVDVPDSRRVEKALASVLEDRAAHSRDLYGELKQSH